MQYFMMVWCYIAVYVLVGITAVNLFLHEFPRERTRVTPGMFRNVHWAIVAIDLLFHPGRTDESEVWITRFLFVLARALLAFLPIVIIWAIVLWLKSG